MPILLPGRERLHLDERVSWWEVRGRPDWRQSRVIALTKGPRSPIPVLRPRDLQSGRRKALAKDAPKRASGGHVGIYLKQLKVGGLGFIPSLYSVASNAACISLDANVRSCYSMGEKEGSCHGPCLRNYL
jgi:hypothetical protein